MTTIKDLYENSTIKSTIGNLTPSGIQAARKQIESMGMPGKSMFITAKSFKDNFEEDSISNDMQNLFDASTKNSELEAGFTGYFLGMYVYSDAYLPPEKQFITNDFVAYHMLEVIISDLEVL